MNNVSKENTSMIPQRDLNSVIKKLENMVIVTKGLTDPTKLQAWLCDARLRVTDMHLKTKMTWVTAISQESQGEEDCMAYLPKQTV